jgi:hypothetical protein
MHGICIKIMRNVINYKLENNITSAKRRIFAKSTNMHHFWTQAEVLSLIRTARTEYMTMNSAHKVNLLYII